MKIIRKTRISGWFIFVCLLAAMFALSSCKPETKRVIAVLPVEMQPGTEHKQVNSRLTHNDNRFYHAYMLLSSPENAVVIRQIVISGLLENRKKNKYRIVDTSHIDRIVEQHKFEASEWSDTLKVAEIGKALNADVVVIIKASPAVQISVSMLDINTMEVLGAIDVIFQVYENSINQFKRDDIKKAVRRWKLNI